MLLSCLAFAGQTVLSVMLQPVLPPALWGLVTPAAALVAVLLYGLEAPHAAGVLCIGGALLAAVAGAGGGLAAALEPVTGGGAGRKLPWAEGAAMLAEGLLSGALQAAPSRAKPL